MSATTIFFSRSEDRHLRYGRAHLEMGRLGPKDNNHRQTVGHEFVGEIVEMGRAVQGYKIGERVSAEGHIVCGVCRACRAGKHHLCPNTKGIGVNRDGCFAEYVSVPSYNAWHIHESIPDEVASIFDPYGNATHTALSFDMVGEDVLITGAGPIGCMAAAIARHVGARNVVVTDVNDYAWLWPGSWARTVR